MTLSTASQIDPASHSEILTILREELRLLQATDSPNLPAAFCEVRVRDWTLAFEEGQNIFRIFLDRKTNTLVSTGSPRPGVSFEECLAYHHRLKDHPVLDRFSDSVVVEVSSRGILPYLRDISDFREAVGLPVVISLWQPDKSGREWKGIIGSVHENDAHGATINLQIEGKGSVQVNLDTIRSCQLMDGSKKNAKPRTTGRAKKSS